MKFKVERNFLVRTYDEEIEIKPEDFLHCATIEELVDEVEDFINDKIVYPTHPNLGSAEELGHRFWTFLNDSNTESFYDEWQKLKNLPEELL